MAFALVNSRSEGLAIHGGTTTGIDTSGADLLIIGLATYAVNTPAFTDNKSNTWTALTERTFGSVSRHRFYYCASPIVGSGHTINCTGSVTYPSVQFWAFSGAHASPFDVENGGGATATSLTVGSVTPSVNGCLVVTGDSFNPGSAGEAVSSPFSSNVNIIAYSGGAYFGQGFAYEIQTTATARNAQWSGSNVTRAGNSAVFKSAAAASGAGPIFGGRAMGKGRIFGGSALVC